MLDNTFSLKFNFPCIELGLATCNYICIERERERLINFNSRRGRTHMYTHTHLGAYVYLHVCIPYTKRTDWISFEACLIFQADLYHEVPWLGVIFNVSLPTL